MSKLEIHKFGGASVRDAASVRRVCGIVAGLPKPAVVVVSAMGKTTNALETIVDLWFRGDARYFEELIELKSFHLKIVRDLFSADLHEFNSCFTNLDKALQAAPTADFGYEYDRIVPFGELLSTTIVAAYLRKQLGKARWFDVRTALRTDNAFREATVDWGASSLLASELFSFGEHEIIVTQGFIGSTSDNRTTTLGREGSDYTAAALAWLLDASSVTVWKDVPGIMDADPKWMPQASPVPQLSYSETVELAFFGAKVIHPKTLRPLQLKSIPLYVRSFNDISAPGTQIGQVAPGQETPFYIRKENQILVTLVPRDFTFMGYGNLTAIHDVFHRNRLNVNLMQMSALSYSVCFDYRPELWEAVRVELSNDFGLRYNTEVELVTVRHCDTAAIERVTRGRRVMLEQRTRKTAQFVLELR